MSSHFVILGVYGSLCVLWKSMSVYGNLWINMSMWVSRGIYGILWVFLRIHAYLWVVGGYGYLCGSMGICEFVRVYGSLWGIWRWELSTHEVPRDTHKQPLTPIDRQTDRQTGRQADRQTFSLFWVPKTYKTWTFIKRRIIFFSIMRLQYFLFLYTPYMMRK